MLELKTQNHNFPTKKDLRKRSFFFCLTIIKFIKTLPNEKIYWPLTDQLLRSSTSLGANIIEAKSSSSKKEFIHYCEIALKSANEIKYWLYLLKEGKLAEIYVLQILINEVEEISKMLGSSVLTLKGKRKV